MPISAMPLYIDPTVKYVGVSKLRELNATKLKENDETLVIQENDNPVAVLLSFEKYLIIQEQLMSVFNTLELLTDKSELASLQAGLEDIAAGRTRSLAEIKAGLRRKHGQTSEQDK